MCPLWPFHYVAIFVLLFLSVHRLVSSTAEYGNTLYNVTFSTLRIVDLQMSETKMVNFTFPANRIPERKRTRIELSSQNNDIVVCSPSYFEIPPSLHSVADYSGTFNVTGNFMGSTNITIRVHEGKIFYTRGSYYWKVGPLSLDSIHIYDIL